MNLLKPELANATAAAARVGALCLAVVGFATMWESDGRHERSNDWLAERAERRSQAVERGGIADARLATRKSHTRRVADRLQLPEDIAPGQYLVADTSGQVRRVRVTRSMSASTAPERDQYVLRDGSTSIYFIRVRSEVAVTHVTHDNLQRK